MRIWGSCSFCCLGFEEKRMVDNGASMAETTTASAILSERLRTRARLFLIGLVVSTVESKFSPC